MTYDTTLTLFQISVCVFITFIVITGFVLNQYEKNGKFRTTIKSSLIVLTLSGCSLIAFMIMMGDIQGIAERNLMVREQKYQITRSSREIIENYKVYDYEGYQIKYITLKNTIIIIP